MHFTIFGATGKTGSLAVKEALRRGHSVTIFAHKTPPDYSGSGLQIMQGDIHNPADVQAAISPNTDSVISALSSWGTPTKDILSAAMANIIPAMQRHHVWRIVSLTGADARLSGDTLSPMHRITHTLIRQVGAGVLADSEKHLQLLQSSGLDWSVLRSPVMRGSGSPSEYKLTSIRPMPWQTIQRGTVANCLVDMAEHPGGDSRAPFILQDTRSKGASDQHIRPH